LKVVAVEADLLRRAVELESFGRRKTAQHAFDVKSVLSVNLADDAVPRLRQFEVPITTITASDTPAPNVSQGLEAIDRWSYGGGSR
jgi:hypothetical protein